MSRNDILSQVLTLVRLTGDVVYSAELSAPWSLGYGPGPAHFHYVEHGGVYLHRPDAPPVLAEAGDLLLMPRGLGHFLSDDALELADHTDVTETRVNGLASRPLVLGGTGSPTRLISGIFHFEGDAAGTLFSALPDTIHIVGNVGSNSEWIEALAHFLLSEARSPMPGSPLMISRLIDVLVIRALRTWAERRIGDGGWLAGIGEEKIGRAIAAMHADPFRRWTVEALAQIAGMSRSVFAETFNERVGEPPLRYHAQWRLALAADMLESGKIRVGEIARKIGYESDAAFSRAFKAMFGRSPGAYRMDHRTAMIMEQPFARAS